jgi:hypothetical protein|tara:strand:+ start:253 stop:516 length:264 start_codon:yes stop_codon:yes gene_type:complete
MNSKELKKLRRLVRPIQVEWLQTLLPEDQAKEITVDTVEGLLPEQTHAFGQGQLHLSYMTDKWIMKYLKQYPNITTYKELIEVSKNG